ncbi:hypothetical protein, partial [Chelativorans sp. YIM 93263]|uniref:hypothetical protein n=1 Tax=Chelativorans sp. YIM 93263 TaxID=2906648 RepID=UPI002377DBC1
MSGSVAAKPVCVNGSAQSPRTTKRRLTNMAELLALLVGNLYNPTRAGNPLVQMSASASSRLKQHFHNPPPCGEC